MLYEVVLSWWLVLTWWLVLSLVACVVIGGLCCHWWLGCRYTAEGWTMEQVMPWKAAAAAAAAEHVITHEENDWGITATPSLPPSPSNSILLDSLISPERLLSVSADSLFLSIIVVFLPLPAVLFCP